MGSSSNRGSRAGQGGKAGREPVAGGRRKTGRRRTIVAVGGALVVIAGGLWATRTPTLAALTRSTREFQPWPDDDRVRFEPGAEEMAQRVAAFLDSAITTVEAGHGRPLLEPFVVYVGASQASSNAFLGLPPGAPIRGFVRFGDLFLAPSAFDWRGRDVHRESLMHEMAHLLMRQHLGFVAHRSEIPPWFNEALADLVSGAGGEGVSRADARAAILDGPTLHPDSTGALWSLRRAGDYGLSGPMLHRQSTMFLDFLEARDPAGFEGFAGRILDGRTFAAPFRETFGGSVEELWAGFVASLRAERGDGIDPERSEERADHGQADREQ